MRTPAVIGALWRALSLAVVLTLAGLAPGSPALLPTAPSPAHADEWTTYAHPNDLKDVTAVGNTLWLATTGGALRFDIASGAFQQFPRRLAGGPVSQDLTSVCYDAVNGLVYFGSADAGVSQLTVADERWRRFDEVPNNEIRSVRSAAGELFVATAAGFSIRRSASRTDLCNDIDRACCGTEGEACDFPSFDVREFARVDTILWAVTAGGPAEQRGSLWLPHPDPAVLDARTVGGRDGQVYVATTAAQGVFHWNSGTASWAPAGGGLPAGQGLGDDVRLVSSGGELLLCAGPGLFRLEGGDWVSLGLERNTRSVAKVGATYYACTRDGLFSGAPGNWTQRLASGPPLNIAGQAIDVATDGTLWIATIGGVMGLGPSGSWTSYRNGEGGVAAFDIFSIFLDSQDRLWLGKCCCREVGKCPTQFVNDGVVSAPLGAYDGWGMSEDQGHRLWIGTNFAGVYVLNPDGSVLTQLTGENTAQSLHSTSVRTTATDGNRVWLGYEDAGLSILDTKGDPANVAGYSWRYFNGQSGSQLPDATVSDIEVVGANDAWVLTSANLVHFQNNQKVKQVALNLGGEPRRGNALAIDPKGTKWIATSSGVLRVDRNDNVTVLNTSNSDLIGNEVLDVTIDPTNGDILFETRLGASRLHEVATPNPGDGDAAYAYPNPFLPDGAARLMIASTGATTADVYDLVGRPVARFSVTEGWDGRNDSGAFVAPGLYLVVAGGKTLRVGVKR